MHLNSNDDKGINGQSEQLLFFKLELLGAVVDLAVKTANEKDVLFFLDLKEINHSI